LLIQNNFKCGWTAKINGGMFGCSNVFPYL
jgi:hypothetical protein